MLKELSKQERSNSRRQKEKVLALNVKRRYLKSWHAMIQKTSLERRKMQEILMRTEHLIKRKYFNTLYKEFALRQKNKMDESIAIFKYTKKLSKTTLKSFAFYSIKKKLLRIHNIKAKKMNWTRLATLCFTLLIKNTIQEKESANIYAKVFISL